MFSRDSPVVQNQVQTIIETNQTFNDDNEGSINYELNTASEYSSESEDQTVPEESAIDLLRQWAQS